MRMSLQLLIENGGIAEEKRNVSSGEGKYTLLTL